MNTKNELMKKWALMQKQMNDIEEILNNMPDEPEPEPKPKHVEKWQPKGGLWFVAGEGSVTKHRSYEKFSKFGVEYPTKEAAERARDAMRVHNRLLAWLSENDDGWVADWDNINETKWYVYFDYIRGVWNRWSSSVYETPGIVYMSGANAEKLCELLNDGVVEL